MKTLEQNNFDPYQFLDTPVETKDAWSHVRDPDQVNFVKPVATEPFEMPKAVQEVQSFDALVAPIRGEILTSPARHAKRLGRRALRG